MSISPVVLDNEKSKFVESPTRSGAAAIEVVGSLSIGASPFDPPTGAIRIAATIGSLVETYEYKDISNAVLKTITITYANSNKDTSDFTVDVT